MNYYTSMETAQKWGITKRRVNMLCQEGAIEGAYKDGNRWYIPEDSRNPYSDNRLYDYVVTTKEGDFSWNVIKELMGYDGEYRLNLYNELLSKIKDKNVIKKRLGLPLGSSNFKEVVSEYYYIDKTLLIKELLDISAKVILFTRPRRFGKTLNMGMLRLFFEKNDKEDTSVYFKHTDIWHAGEDYRRLQGQDIVIYMTFKDVKDITWDEALEQIKNIISKAYDDYNELADSNKLTERECSYFKRILYGDASSAEWKQSLRSLSDFLFKHYGSNVVILIDEYDIPILQGYSHGFYDEVIAFMRVWLSAGLNDNDSLKLGVLSGVMQVAKESIFSGMNNLYVSSVLDDRFGKYFGFTTDEVRRMLEHYNLEEKMYEVTEWYNGYTFGNTRIYNPWSVINYIVHYATPGGYWNETGNSELIGKLINAMDSNGKKELYILLNGKPIRHIINQSISYKSIMLDTANVFSFLLMTGYLTFSNIVRDCDGELMCELYVPNKEIRTLYKREIVNYINHNCKGNNIDRLLTILKLGNTEELKSVIETYLKKTISFFDASTEGFYHGFMLGLFASFEVYYYITSNRESGLGRFDIQLEPKETGYPAVIIEIKSLSRDNINGLREDSNKLRDVLLRAAHEGLKQIKDNEYVTAMQDKGYRIYVIGVAFSGKQCEVAGEVYESTGSI